MLIKTKQLTSQFVTEPAGRGSPSDVANASLGIDPGSKKEGITVKSEAHTYLNIQADAVMWVKEAVATRRQMRRAWRYRKTPCRKNRSNRAIGGIPPGTKARWQWKLRLYRWLATFYPVACFVVEDLKAHTKGGKRWNQSFSPLQMGKAWLYSGLKKLARVIRKQGWETTKALRDALGLKKTRRKLTDGKRLCQRTPSLQTVSFWPSTLGGRASFSCASAMSFPARLNFDETGPSP